MPAAASDPDDIFAESGKGYSVEFPEESVSSLKRLRNDEQEYESISRGALDLYQERFSPSALTGNYFRRFKSNI